MKKETDFEELMKNVDYTRWLQALIPVMQPIIVFGAWLGFSMFDKKASAVSKLIALAEPIPTIDLNVPPPVVLASLYHSTDEALKVLEDVIAFLKDLEIPSAEKILNDIKEEIAGKGIEDRTQFIIDYTACAKNARDTIPKIAYNKYTASTWIMSCMIQKGYTRALIEEEIRSLLEI